VLTHQTFKETISQSNSDSIIYCNPPYIGRHADYYNGWDESHENELNKELSLTNNKFILSTWHHNDYRENEYIASLWNEYNILTREHFYHVGGSEKNRSPMIEAIITNYNVSNYVYKEEKKPEQLSIFEAQAKYKEHNQKIHLTA
jgi:DNA adenine methylase